MNFTYAAQPTGTSLISLVDMKQFLRVDHSDEDTTITAIIDAAVQSIQDYTGRHFVDTTWAFTMEYMRNTDIPYGVTSITGVTYYDTTDASVTLSTENYYSGSINGVYLIKFLDTPSVKTNRLDAVTIAGTVTNQINPPLTHAVKMLAAHYYENRRAAVVGAITSVMPFGIQAIINPYRLIVMK